MEAASGSIIQAGTRNDDSASALRVKCRTPLWSWSATTTAERPNNG